MEADLAITAYRENVTCVASIVFQTMLNLDIKRCSLPWSGRPDMVTAAVHFAGAWQGAVLLECTPLQACRFAELLMSIDPPEIIDDDVRDAVGELANMLAGNLKSVLPPGVVLSMPLVVDGLDYSLQMCGKQAVERALFCCTEGIFAVTMVETLR